MAVLDRLRVYPVKALDGIDVEAASLTPGGTLARDREFALFDGDGDVVNGKRTAAVHDLETSFDPASDELVVDAPGSKRARFDLGRESGRAGATRWFGAYFDVDVTLRRDRSLGYVDRRTMGPSVIATATLEAVAGWFEDLTVDGVRRRMRANLEVGGVEPFWEDRFVGTDAPAFEVGGIRFEGVTPCGRCVVPERDPNSGERTPDFRERFVEKREETFPGWADEAAFDHFYSLMTITRVRKADRDGTLSVGDAVSVVE